MTNEDKRQEERFYRTSKMGGAIKMKIPPGLSGDALEKWQQWAEGVAKWWAEAVDEDRRGRWRKYNGF